MNTITELGWSNAGGEIGERIRMAVEACNALGHKRLVVSKGSYGTWHVITCDQCGFTYSEDSGD